MGDNQQDLVMRLQFLADTRGAAEANKTIDDLKKKAGDTDKNVGAANKTLGQAGQVAGRAAEQIGTVAGAMGSAGGAAGRAAAGVRLLSGAIQTMTAAGGGIAGLISAIALLATSALVNWLVKVSAETKKLNEEAGKTNSVLTSMSRITLEAITSQQEKMRKSASDTADQYERILQAKNRMTSAQEQADLAQLDLDKAVDLSRAPKSDPFAARRIEAEYAAKAAAVSAEAERRRQNNEVAVSESKVKDLRTQASGSDAEASRIAALIAHDEQRLADMKREAAAPSMKESDRAKLTDDIVSLRASMDDLRKAFEAAREKAAYARSQLPAAELDVLTARTTRAANDIRNDATGAQNRNALSSIDYDQNEAAKAAQLRLRDLGFSERDRRERDSELSSAATKESADVRNVNNGLAKGDLAKEVRERDAALKALADYRRDSVAFYTDLRAEMEKLREAIKNNPAQN